ncbi:MAG: hypothetical protein LBT24_01405 [Tannerella sp.]|jgi:hypothetical protein|nr:hypothetical protein [Tannerella sp.]
MKNSIQLNQVLELLPKKTRLAYVDSSDDLNKQAKLLQECVEANNVEALYDKYNDWFWEQEGEFVDEYKQELRNDLQSKYDLTDDEAGSIMEKFDEEIRDVIYAHSDSDGMEDMLRNTRKFVFCYGTGLSIPDTCFMKYGEKMAEVRRIKRKLKIDAQNKDYDKALKELIDNAVYGGELFVFFLSDAEDWFQGVHEETGLDIQWLQFKDAEIALVDYYNGSGYDVQLKGYTFKLPFERRNLTIDESIKYSYTHDICGMSNNWCSSTTVDCGYDKLKRTRKPAISAVSAINALDKKCNETFRKGKCTPGDMDITRHRDVYYINDFPCGNKCPHCGTFWID